VKRNKPDGCGGGNMVHNDLVGDTSWNKVIWKPVILKKLILCILVRLIAIGFDWLTIEFAYRVGI
jgi:hypothetical protein